MTGDRLTTFYTQRRPVGFIDPAPLRYSSGKKKQVTFERAIQAVVEREERLSVAIKRHLAPPTDKYKQTRADSCPEDATFPIICPCQETKLASQIHRKLGPNLLIVLPGNLTTWVDENKAIRR